MNTYGIIVIVLGVIFAGIMVYVFYNITKPQCGDNQEYISCDGGGKACYPICDDDQTLECSQKICTCTPGENQQLYGPTTTPACDGDYFCADICDSSKGEVMDCKTQTCTVQCSSGQVVHNCPDGSIQCSDAECQDGFTIAENQRWIQQKNLQSL